MLWKVDHPRIKANHPVVLPLYCNLVKGNKSIDMHSLGFFSKFKEFAYVLLG